MERSLGQIKQEIRGYYPEEHIDLSKLKTERAAETALYLAKYGVKASILTGRIDLINHQIEIDKMTEDHQKRYWDTWLDNGSTFWFRPDFVRTKTQFSLFDQVADHSAVL